jgi:phosphate transport system substrate-binding protein
MVKMRDLVGGLIWFWPSIVGRRDGADTHASNTGSTAVPTSANVTITGSGSTAIMPAMEYWASIYEQQTGIKIKYDGIGSGRGVDNMIDKVLDFGCTGAYMTDAQLAKVKDAKGEVIHIPLVMGARQFVSNCGLDVGCDVPESAGCERKGAGQIPPLGRPRRPETPRRYALRTSPAQPGPTH